MIFRKRISPEKRAMKWLNWMDEGVGDELLQEIRRYPKAITETKVPLVHVAILAERYEVLRILLEEGANPNLIDQYGQAPILVAAEKGVGRPFVDLLINHGADVNITDRHGASPIMYAARANQLATVEGLLQASADPNHRDIEGDTVLMYAVTSDNLPLITLLIEAGANPSQPNFDGLTAFDKSTSEPARSLLKRR